MDDNRTVGNDQFREIIDILEEKNGTKSELMGNFTEFSPKATTSDYVQMFYYSLFVIVGVPLNVKTMYRAARRYHITHGRVFLLQFHLNISDLMILIFHAIFMICWYATYEWLAGVFFCKTLKFFEMIAFLISSNIIVCIGFDRLSSLTRGGSAEQRLNRVKVSLVLAWSAAVLCSAPMLFTWTQSTGNYKDSREYKQCVIVLPPTLAKTWAGFSVIVNFWIPALLITICYGIIAQRVHDKLGNDGKDVQVVNLRENEYHCQQINRKRLRAPGPERSLAYSEGTGSLLSNGTSQHTPAVTCYGVMTQAAMACFHANRQNVSKLGVYHPANGTEQNTQRTSLPTVKSATVSNGVDRRKSSGLQSQPKRYSANQIRLRRTKYRTLTKTFMLVAAYIICWTPYNVLQLWSIFDNENYLQFEDSVYFLYGLITLNSVLNPLIYGDTLVQLSGSKKGREWFKKRLCCKL